MMCKGISIGSSAKCQAPIISACDTSSLGLGSNELLNLVFIKALVQQHVREMPFHNHILNIMFVLYVWNECLLGEVMSLCPHIILQTLLNRFLLNLAHTNCRINVILPHICWSITLTLCEAQIKLDFVRNYLFKKLYIV